ncbi:MAG: C-GCAxxG-C-C family protein [Candidatus Bathyarchaeia archaeon]
MANYELLRDKVEELASRHWDAEGIRERVVRIVQEGIPRKSLDPEILTEMKSSILGRVQRRAEEYNFILKNCAQGTALALLEEFGVGSMEMIKALTAFPGIAGTGEVCGAITGSLVAFGLILGSDDRFDYETTDRVIMLGQKFIAFFEDEIGYIHCSDIIENVVIGKKLNPGESSEAMAEFVKEKGFEKCGLPPGIGAKLAAEFIIDELIKRSR